MKKSLIDKLLSAPSKPLIVIVFDKKLLKIILNWNKK